MSRDVLVIDNYDSFTFNLTALIADAGRGFTVVRNDAIAGVDLDQYEKVLISPGPGKPDEAGGICGLIRSAAATKCILGICLGHQAIAEVFGARLSRLTRPDHGVVRTVRVRGLDCYLFDGIHGEFSAGVYHSWTVVPDPIPTCLEVTADSTAGAVMALSHREYDVHGLQFHPESVMTPLGRKIIGNWLAHSPGSSTLNSESSGRRSS